MNFGEHLQELLSHKAEVAKGMLTLIKLEAQLASLSFYHLLVIFGAISLLLVTTWLTTMLLIGYGVFWATGYVLLAILVVLLLNIGLLIYASTLISDRLKNMSFEKTRSCFSAQPLREENDLRKKTISNDR